MAEVKEETQKAKPPKQSQKKQANPKPEYDDYLIFLHRKKVEVHVDYGGTVLKLTGTLRAKARFDIQLIIDEEKKEIITINKAYLVMVKPV